MEATGDTNENIDDEEDEELDDEGKERDDELKNWVDTVIEILKNPICGETISEQAVWLQNQIKSLKQELKRVEENNTMQLLLQR